MILIHTKALSATNTLGSRIVAKTPETHARPAVRATTGWDWALDVYENHLAAAEVLAEKADIEGRLVHLGSTLDGDGEIFAIGTDHECLGKRLAK